MNLKCYIDNREQNRIKSASFYYRKQGLEVEVSELEIGDYIFTDGEHDIVFEFKTVPDFISSIQSGRVFNQSINMAEEYNHRFVIIHGDEHTRAKALAMSRNYQRVTVYQYINAISSLNRYVTVIESYSPYIEEAYFRMLSQAKKIIQDKPIVKKFPRKDKNPAFNWLCYCNYGINMKKAQLIVDELGLKTLTDLQRLTYDDLTMIKGIGDNLANRILGGLR